MALGHGNGRHYTLICLRGSSATPCQFSTWAWGIIDAFNKAKEAGYWPLSVIRSGWHENHND